MTDEERSARVAVAKMNRVRSHRHRGILDEILSVVMAKVLMRAGSVTAGHDEAVDVAGW